MDKVWNYDLVDIHKNELTVKQLFIGIFIILFGVLLAFLFKKTLNKFLTARNKLSLRGITAVDRLTFYTTIVFFVILALEVVHIPLATFAFLGGGLAVGIGFGAKNLINNFLSGFVLITERPVRVGDIIEVKEEIGVIEEIGMRCTKIHTENNVHIILPNSDLLENKIINWTLSDNMILTKTAVNIAYNSDVPKAKKLMIEAAKSLECTLDKPEPFVLFWEYGASTLAFHVYFAIIVKNKMQRWEKESAVRFKLNEALQGNGISLAFPQRDVHLDVSKPLDLRILNEK